MSSEFVHSNSIVNSAQGEPFLDWFLYPHRPCSSTVYSADSQWPFGYTDLKGCGKRLRGRTPALHMGLTKLPLPPQIGLPHGSIWTCSRLLSTRLKRTLLSVIHCLPQPPHLTLPAASTLGVPIIYQFLTSAVQTRLCPLSKTTLQKYISLLVAVLWFKCDIPIRSEVRTMCSPLSRLLHIRTSPQKVSEWQ